MVNPPQKKEQLEKKEGTKAITEFSEAPCLSFFPKLKLEVIIDETKIIPKSYNKKWHVWCLEDILIDPACLNNTVVITARVLLWVVWGGGLACLGIQYPQIRNPCDAWGM